MLSLSMGKFWRPFVVSEVSSLYGWVLLRSQQLVNRKSSRKDAQAACTADFEPMYGFYGLPESAAGLRDDLFWRRRRFRQRGGVLTSNRAGCLSLGNDCRFWSITLAWPTTTRTERLLRSISST